MAKPFAFKAVRRGGFPIVVTALLLLIHTFVLCLTQNANAHAMPYLVDKPMTLEKFASIEGKAAEYGFRQEKIQDYYYAEMGDFLLVRSVASADCDKDVCRSIAVFRGKIASAMYLPALYVVSDAIANISDEEFIDLYFSQDGTEWAGFLIGQNRLIVRHVQTPYAPQANTKQIEQ